RFSLRRESRLYVRVVAKIVLNDRPDDLRETMDSLVDLGWRERAKWQAQESLSASFREKRKAVGQIEGTSRSLRPHRGCGRALGESQGNEEPAVGTRRRRLGQVFVETSQTGIETRR